MKLIVNKLFFLSIAFLGIGFSSFAQKNYSLELNPNFFVSGTSTLHDWEMKSVSGTGIGNFSVSNSKLLSINEITILMPSESIKSGKGTMDRIAYEALKTDKYKIIKYVLKSAEKVNETTWNLVGTYSIAGVSKEMKTQVRTSINNGIISLQGMNKITFNDFAMKPPTALFGTIKTGNDLIIKFNINFK